MSIHFAAPGGASGRARFAFIDALRGLAALSVVLFHMREGHHIDALARVMPRPVHLVFENGDLGVQVFFVLSGFVVAHSMARHHVDRGYFGRFLLRRSLRLDPPYWASMALVVMFGMLSAKLIPGKHYEPPTAANVVLHVLYLANLSGHGLINSVYWTLCLEIQFYAVFALMMLVITWLRPRLGDQRAFYVVLLPATLFASLWAVHMQPFDVVGLFVGHWYFFLLGVLVWRAVADRDARFGLWLACADIVLLGATALRSSEPSSRAHAVAALTALAILLTGRTNRLGTWLSARPLQTLGLISYSVYLIHNPVQGAAFRLGYKLTGSALPLQAFWGVIVTLVCVACGWLFYRLVERPSIALSQRIDPAATRSAPRRLHEPALDDASPTRPSMVA